MYYMTDYDSVVCPRFVLSRMSFLISIKKYREGGGA